MAKKRRQHRGRMDRRITLLQETESRGSSGGEILTYDELATVWAEVKFIFIDDEDNEAARRTAFQRATFRIDYRRDLDTIKRVRYENKEYDVEQTHELMTERRHGYTLIRAIYRS